MIQIPALEDYVDAIQTPQLIKAATLQGGHPEVMLNGSPLMYTGGYCVVFPYNVGSKKYAVRCWHAYLSGGKERCREISSYLDIVSLPYFAKFQYVEDGIVTKQGPQPIVIMDWVEGKTLKDFIKENLHNKNSLKKLADDFKFMVKQLHQNSISHGDLQHGNILVKKDGGLMLVDYDSIYVPALNGYTDEIQGLKGYQHPARFTNRSLSPKADYFSELIIYTSILAIMEQPELWNDLQMEDTETMVFSSEDIESLGNAPIFQRLKNIPKTKELIDRIKSELRKTNIEELSCLEENCISFLDDIRNDFADNGYTRPKLYKKEAIKEISDEW